MANQPGVIFGRQDAERIARTVKAHERQPVNLVGPRLTKAHPNQFHLVRSRGTISGQLGRMNGRIIIPDTENDSAGDLHETNLGTAATTDNVILWDLDAVRSCRVAVPIGFNATEKKPIYGLIPRGVFPVFLTKTGGTAGNKTTPVSFTYTVKDLFGETLGTTIAPRWPSRSENGLKSAATEGLAWWSDDGLGTTLLNLFAFEAAGTGGCP